MKELVLGATMLVGVAYSKYEIAYAPDIHMNIKSAHSCTELFADPELLSGEFERVLCEAAKAIPYDSVNCLLNAVGLRARNRIKIDAEKPPHDEPPVEAPDKQSYVFYCGDEPCVSEDPPRRHGGG